MTTGPGLTRIRPIALGIFWRGDQILVFEGYDPTIGETFYRPLGGAIEFGEYSHQALARELQEELGTGIKNLRRLGTLENLFTFDGRPWHEIVLLYEGDLDDSVIYQRDVMIGHEHDGSTFKAMWRNLRSFQHGTCPLYPDGLLELLLGQTARAGNEE